MIKVKTNPMKYKDSNGNMIDVGGVIGKEVTDLTLTKSNVPADSKTVGDKLNKLSEEKADLNWGASNVGKILMVGSDGKLVLTDMPEASGDVTGVLDDSNNILLSGNLADGTYPLKWLLDDGTYADAGSLTVAAIPEPPSYTNLATTFATGRLKSGGNIDTATTAATVCLDYIPFVQGTVVRVKGFGALTDYNCAMYTAEPTSDMIGVVTDSVPSCYSSSKANESASVYSYSYDSTSGIVTLTSLHLRAKVLRVSGILTGTTDDVIITVNEDIA